MTSFLFDVNGLYCHLTGATKGVGRSEICRHVATVELRHKVKKFRVYNQEFQ